MKDFYQNNNKNYMNCNYIATLIWRDTAPLGLAITTLELSINKPTMVPLIHAL